MWSSQQITSAPGDAEYPVMLAVVCTAQPYFALDDKTLELCGSAQRRYDFYRTGATGPLGDPTIQAAGKVLGLYTDTDDTWYDGDLGHQLQESVQAHDMPTHDELREWLNCLKKLLKSLHATGGSQWVRRSV
jgi:hypothetical protein